MDVFELEHIRIQLRQLACEAKSPYETGFVASQYKRQLVEMKWFLDDLINDIGYFAGEESWEQERIIKVLSKEN